MMIFGAGKLMPPGKFEIYPGKIKIVIGKTISTNGYTAKDLPALKAKVLEAMQNIG
jgi:hypothetical protein